MIKPDLLGDTSAIAGPDLWERLVSFRSTHPLKHVNIADVGWAYIACGQGEQTLVILPGFLGEPDLAFLQISALENEYRVIAPRYPAVETMTTCLDGIIGILAAEDVAQAHVLGGSFGGIIAQALARRNPDKIGKLILSHTLVPSADRAQEIEKFRSLVSVMPMWLLRWMSRLKLRRALPGTAEVSIRRFLRTYLDEKLATLTKADLRSRHALAIDIARNCVIQQADSFGWAKRVLILEGDNDRMVRAADREELKRVYPDAQVHTFRGTGHAASLMKPDEFLSVLRSFLVS